MRRHRALERIKIKLQLQFSPVLKAVMSFPFNRKIGVGSTFGKMFVSNCETPRSCITIEQIISQKLHVYR